MTRSLASRTVPSCRSPYWRYPSFAQCDRSATAAPNPRFTSTPIPALPTPGMVLAPFQPPQRRAPASEPYVPHATANLPREPINTRTIGFADWLRFLYWYAACGRRGAFPAFRAPREAEVGRGAGSRSTPIGTPSYHPLSKQFQCLPPTFGVGAGLELRHNLDGAAHITISALRCTPITCAPIASVSENPALALVKSPRDLALGPIREHRILRISGRATQRDERHKTECPQ
jgi:hypothetical protein